MWRHLRGADVNRSNLIPINCHLSFSLLLIPDSSTTISFASIEVSSKKNRFTSLDSFRGLLLLQWINCLTVNCNRRFLVRSSFLAGHFRRVPPCSYTWFFVCSRRHVDKNSVRCWGSSLGPPLSIQPKSFPRKASPQNSFLEVVHFWWTVNFHIAVPRCFCEHCFFVLQCPEAHYSFDLIPECSQQMRFVGYCTSWYRFLKRDGSKF